MNQSQSYTDRANSCYIAATTLLLRFENQRTGEVHRSDDSCYIAVTTPATSQQQSKTLKRLTTLLQ